jgi:tRNA modification GTPase
MQSAAADARTRAELTLWCSPADAPAPPATHDAATVVVHTKGDLADASDGLVVSAVTGRGVDELRGVIAERLARRAVSLAGDAVALLTRHESALRAAVTDLEQTLQCLDESELVAASMRSALDALGALAGEVTPDDVLGRIFASFCVGK